MAEFIPVNEPLLDGNEKKYLMECIETGWISSEGPFIAEFENKFSERCNRRYGIAVSNGTAAIDIAVEALGIGPDDEIILPAFTIISCVNQIIRAGAKPVFIDSDPASWNMDVDQIEDKITDKTRAIMIVHIYGLPVDMEPIINIANKYNLKIIEDAAEAHGQTYNGRPCGSFGDISTFSFYPNKHVTTGEGGMILTNDESLAESCRSLRNLCFQPQKRFVHEKLGWNARMTNMQAALGLAQLERLDKFIEQKKKMGELYTTHLSQFKEYMQLPLTKTPYADNNYWVFGVVMEKSTGLNAEIMMKKLAGEQVGTRPFFYPLHMQPILRKLHISDGVKLPISENLYLQGFYLPSGLALTEVQIDNVVKRLQKILP